MTSCIRSGSRGSVAGRSRTAGSGKQSAIPTSTSLRCPRSALTHFCPYCRGWGSEENQRINPTHQLSNMLYRYPFRNSGTTELGSTSPSRGMVARITSAT
jgi:hypothetical protein